MSLRMRQDLIARLTWTVRVINHSNCLLKVRWGVTPCWQTLDWWMDSLFQGGVNSPKSFGLWCAGWQKLEQRFGDQSSNSWVLRPHKVREVNNYSQRIKWCGRESVFQREMRPRNFSQGIKHQIYSDQQKSKNIFLTLGLAPFSEDVVKGLVNSSLCS